MKENKNKQNLEDKLRVVALTEKEKLVDLYIPSGVDVIDFMKHTEAQVNNYQTLNPKCYHQALQRYATNFDLSMQEAKHNIKEIYQIDTGLDYNEDISFL